MFSTAARAAPEWTIPGIPWCGERVTLITLPARLRDERLGRRGVGHLPGALDVELDDGAKALRRDRLGGAEELPAGVVDEQVDAAVALERLRRTAPSTASSSRMSSGDASAVPPGRSTSAASLLERLERRPQPTTVAPSAASSSAVALPMPVPAPETTHTCPSSRPGAKIREPLAIGRGIAASLSVSVAGVPSAVRPGTLTGR